MNLGQGGEETGLPDRKAVQRLGAIPRLVDDLQLGSGGPALLPATRTSGFSVQAVTNSPVQYCQSLGVELDLSARR